ncbi:MAG: hypothetical protein RBU37_08160 [Myxococcota bacterium]|jgi:hypothetical protein|nr:hypothetical protein [Myxococcota bacterium]
MLQGVVLLLNLGLWAGLLMLLWQRSEAQRERQWRLEALYGEQLEAEVQKRCAASPEDPLLLELDDTQAARLRERYHRALWPSDCFGRLDEAEQRQFRLEHASWLLEDPEAIERYPSAELIELLPLLPTQPAGAVAAALSERSLSEAERSLAIELALASLATPKTHAHWAVPLLEALDLARFVSWLSASAQAQLQNGSSPFLSPYVAHLERHWRELPKERQRELLAASLSAQVHVRKAGSLNQLQPVALELRFVPPEGSALFSGALAYAALLSIEIDGENAREGSSTLASTMPAILLRDGGWALRQLDLQQLFSRKERVKLTLAWELALLPTTAKDVLDGDGKLTPQGRELALFYDSASLGPRNYWVNLGADSSPPKRINDKKVEKLCSKSIGARFVGPARVELLSNGAIQTSRPEELSLSHREGAALELWSTAPLSNAVALRVQARSKQNNAWVDIGDALLPEGPSWPERPPIRTELDLGAVCPQASPCALELRLRSSYRVARMDARLEHYLGPELELGSLKLSFTDSANGQHWRVLQGRALSILDEAP